MTLPDTVVYGIVYNTSHFGPVPLGEGTACYATAAGCPYDSLNIALSDVSDESAGSSTHGTVWQNSPYASQYCSPGLTGTFRADGPNCWDPYLPAVQFKAGH